MASIKRRSIRQRHRCKSCERDFDDLRGLSSKAIANPCACGYYACYFMGLNLSNAQIAKELDRNKDDADIGVRAVYKGSYAPSPFERQLFRDPTVLRTVLLDRLLRPSPSGVTDRTAERLLDLSAEAVISEWCSGL